MFKKIRSHPLFQQVHPYILVALAFGSYAVVFASYQSQYGTGIASLATIPVVVAGWYFGLRGGMTIALLSIAVSGVLEALAGNPVPLLLADAGNILRSISLILVALVTGRLSSITRERMDAIHRLEQYEREQRVHTEFLELLNEVTARALEADNLHTTLEILVEQIARLFKADDSFFAFWDAERAVAVPAVAYGVLRDVYPYIAFDPSEQTLTASVLHSGYPIPVSDVENSPHISPKVAILFPSRSMLGIPFIVQGRPLGALELGYNTGHSFTVEEILRARLTSEQVALVVSKSLLLEEERKQVKQLTALHDVALTAIEVDNEDQLIERVTEIIGKNLFPDNFGILLLDENMEALRPHPSYRFYAAEEVTMQDMPLGTGITGQVAQTGQPQRLGNVRVIAQYVDVDDRTISELCVPIKFKERILGVVNAESSKKNAFSVEDERLLVTLAGQLAIAIEQLRRSLAERVWLDQLAHSNDLIYAVAQITTQIERALTTDDIIHALGQELRKLSLTCIMAVYDNQRKSFTVNYTSLEPEFLRIVEKGLGYPLVEYSFSRDKLGQALNARDILRPASLSNPEDEIQLLFTDTERPGVLRILSEIGITPGVEPLRLPLAFEDNLMGILWVWGEGLRKSDLPIMSIFAKQVGVSLERARLFQEVQSLALTDPLTGLHNRRNIFELGRVEFARAHRMNRPFCCMMLDLDHFKQVNDNYGHQVGDQVLQEFAGRCKKAVREMDIVGRYGGEELIIIMPETEITAAVPVAERLRKCVADTPFKGGGHEVPATVSIGVAQKDENTLQLETLIARADQAMYIAKHRGRNRVATSK